MVCPSENPVHPASRNFPEPSLQAAASRNFTAATSEVRDILLALRGDNPYNVHKQVLLTRLVSLEQRRLQQLLSAGVLDDRKPSQFLRHLKHLLDEKAAALNTAILREHFLQHLPASVRVGLVPAYRLPLSEHTDLADRIMGVTILSVSAVAMNTATNQSSSLALLASEIRELRSTVDTCPARSEAPLNAAGRPLSLTPSALEITELRSENRHLSGEVAGLRHESHSSNGQRSRSTQGSSPAPSRRSSPLVVPNDFCHYQRQFGAQARRC